MFGFRLYALLEPGKALIGDAQRVELSELADLADHLVCHIVEPVDEGDLHPVVIMGDGFGSLETAGAAGELARSAIRHAALRTRIGIDVGDDRVRSGLGEDARSAIESRLGQKIVPHIHGLTLFEGTVDDIKVFSMKGTLTVGTDIRTFLSSLADTYAAGRVLVPRVELAIDLHSLARFESSQRAQFLTLISALEVLSVRTTRPPLVLEMLADVSATVQRVIKEAPHGSDENTSLRSLAGSLSDLKKTSITQGVVEAGEALLSARTYEDLTVGQFLRKCYRIRSEITHDGRPKDSNALPRLLDALAHLVTDLLVELVTQDEAWIEPSSA